MLNKLKELRENHEDGFTLIELLVVILIIGILASIAIPVFLNQRKTANDGAVQSDVKNASSQIETWIVGQSGKDVAIPATLKSEIKASAGVSIAVSGTSNNYCIIGAHDNGKNYVRANAAAVPIAANLSYSSADGGIGKACSVALPAAWNLYSSGVVAP